MSWHEGPTATGCTVRGCCWGAWRLLADELPHLDHDDDPDAWHRIEAELEAAYQRAGRPDPERIAAEWRRRAETAPLTLF